MVKQRIDSEDVTDAALEVIDASGPDELTLSRVAGELGVQSSALYNHIESLSGLRRNVAAAASEALTTALRDAAIARSGRDALVAVGTAYRRFAVDHPGQFAAATFLLGDPAPETTQAITSITELFVRIVDGLGVAEDRIIDDARAIHSAIRGFVILETTQGFDPSADLNTSFEHLLEVLLQGISPNRS